MNGFLYVISLSSGVTKVGRSRKPNHRIIGHAQEAERYGVRVVRQWVSTEHGQCDESERSLIAACRSAGCRAHGNEYFVIDFDEAVCLAEFVVRDAPAPDDEGLDTSREDVSRKLMDTISSGQYTSKDEIRSVIGCGMKPLQEALATLKRSGRIIKRGRNMPYEVAA